ncbi:MAG: aminopeptidase P N-terminal domain-containing protein [Burkholderiales bacterium]
MIPIPRYQRRRAQLAKTMQCGIAVIPTADEKARNRDTQYPYRFDSHFYYLTGFMEPGAVAVVIAGKNPKTILFCREKDLSREIWDGYRFGPKAAQKQFAFDEAYPIAKLDELMPKLIADQPTLHYPLGADAAWDARVFGWINQVKAQVRSGISAPAEIQDVRTLLDDMRLVKDGDEIATMRRAADISSDAHRRAMQTTKPGMMEYQIEAELLHEFRRRGAQAPAYTSIVAGGANGCVLHYVENNDPLKSGDLLLIDAGCELDGYASDITRAFPVNGRFSAAQRDVYELVLAAQASAISAVKANASFENYHEVALKILVRGFIDLKLCKGSVDQVLESGDYKRFYMHRTGHWLGLDVHDAGDYKKQGKAVKLAPGMVVTVEPGCYIRPGKDVPKAFWNIGIRIEDDVLVTKTGRDILTHPPKTVRDIEHAMQG